MKKVLALFILTILTVSLANAQFGVRAGFNSANFSDTNFDARTGFHLGAYYTIEGTFLSVEPGLFFSKKGYQGTELGTGRSVDENLSYVDVPLLFRLNVLPSFNVFAGPQAALLLSREYQIGDQISTTTDIIRGYDLGGVVGAQVILPFGLNAQANFDFGLTSLNYFNTQVKNQVFKVSLGYTLGGR